MNSHYSEAIKSAMASQISGISIVCSIICSGADQRKHQSSVSLTFVRGIHRWRVDSPHKRPVTRKMFLFDDVKMDRGYQYQSVIRSGITAYHLEKNDWNGLRLCKNLWRVLKSGGYINWCRSFSWNQGSLALTWIKLCMDK